MVLKYWVFYMRCFGNFNLNVSYCNNYHLGWWYAVFVLLFDGIGKKNNLHGIYYHSVALSCRILTGYYSTQNKTKRIISKLYRLPRWMQLKVWLIIKESKCDVAILSIFDTVIQYLQIYSCGIAVLGALNMPPLHKKWPKCDTACFISVYTRLKTHGRLHNNNHRKARYRKIMISSFLHVLISLSVLFVW